MHPNPIFHSATDGETERFIAQRGFGTWVTNGSDLPVAAAAPFSCIKDANGELGGLNAHLMRANPLAKLLKNGPRACRVIINGPDGYVSPDWYGVDNQVPTWNYIDAYVDGEVALLPDDALPDILAELSATFEKRLLPKPEWLIDKMQPDILSKMMQAIVPIRLRVDNVSATWKLSQNKPEKARKLVSKEFRENAAKGRSDLGTDLDKLALWLDQTPQQ